MASGPDRISSGPTFFGVEPPAGTGAPGSDPAPQGSPGSQSSSSQLGSGFISGQVQPSVGQVSQGLDRTSPQDSRPGFTDAAGYASDGPHTGSGEHIPHPDAGGGDR